MLNIYQRVDILNHNIAGNSDKHQDLIAERAKLYTKAAKFGRAKKQEFQKNWVEILCQLYFGEPLR